MSATKVHRYSASNKIGMFNITHQMLNDRELMHSLFGLCTVLDCFDHESGRGKTYIAASDLFQPLGEGEEIPQYRIEFDHPTMPLPLERAQECIRSGAFGWRAVRNHIIRVPPLDIRAQARTLQ